MTGKLIVLYGINNLGKSTQAKITADNIKNSGLKVEYLKYPIYDLAPTGPKIDAILRGGNGQNISELELQDLYAQNRRDFQPRLISLLEQGINVVAEDYIGTGLAWGVTKGAPLPELEKQNHDLVKEDVAILLDGARFLQGKEDNHLHEQSDGWMNRCRQVHLDLAKKYGWIVVNANNSIDRVNADIWQTVETFIK